MIRQTRIIIFLVIILGSTVLLSTSSFYQIDTYRAMSFPVEITDIRLVQNETSGEYRRIEVDIRVENPSFTLPLRFYWANTRIFLNDGTFRYGWGQKGHLANILPGESYELGWHYSIDPQDFPLIEAARTGGNWNWRLYMEPFVEAGFLGREELTRIIIFEGITILLI